MRVEAISPGCNELYHHRRQQQMARNGKGDFAMELKVARGKELEKGHVYRANVILRLKKLMKPGAHEYNYPQWTGFKVYDKRMEGRVPWFKVGPVSDGAKVPKGSGWVSGALLNNVLVREEVDE